MGDISILNLDIISKKLIFTGLSAWNPLKSMFLDKSNSVTKKSF
jgi:hypothetical protein